MNILRFCLFIAFSYSAAAQNCDTFFCGEFVPVKQKKSDSVCYLFTLSRVYELHTTKGYTNQYDVTWSGFCEFELQLDKQSGDTAAHIKDKKRFHCTVNYRNDSVVSFFREAQPATELKKNSGTSFYWLSFRDKEFSKLAEDSHKAMDALKGHEGDSLLTQFMNLFSKSTLSMAELLRADKHEVDAYSVLFRCLRGFDAASLYSHASVRLGEQISQQQFQDYFDFVKNVYGKWESFRVESQTSSLPLLGLDETGTSSQAFSVKWEKMTEPVLLTVKLSSEKDVQTPVEGQPGSHYITPGPKTFLGIDLTPGSEQSPYLDKLTAPFFLDFYNKNDTAIYRKSATPFKTATSEEQVVNLLTLVRSMTAEKFAFHSHAYTMNKEYGGLITLHFTAPTKTKTLFLSLTYMNKGGEYELGAINLKEH